MKYILFSGFLVALLFFGCKKEEEDILPETFGVTEQGSNDETARNEYDESIENVFEALESTSFGSRGADSGLILPCGVINIDTTGGKSKVVYGGNCGRKVLSGTIVATLSPSSGKWSDAGAIIHLDYQNYTVLFEVNNQTLVFNGTIVVTNLNGGLMYETLTKKSTIEHKIRGNLNITFDNGSTRTWQIFKKRSYSASNGKVENLQARLAADSTGNIAEVGVTKAGENFVTTMPYTFVYQNCSAGSSVGPFILVEGKLVFTVNSNSLTIEAGQQFVSGKFISVNDCSAYGYKLSWNIGGTTRDEFQYY